MEENVGNIHKRNKLGYSPIELNHGIVLNDIDPEVRHYFKEMDQVSQEGDYMIISSETESNKTKKDIVLEQLNQLNLVRDKDYFVYIMEPDDDKVSKVFISIKIPQHVIDETAHKMKLKGTLTQT